MIQSISGKDTIKINDRILNDMADGDTALLEYPNTLASIKTGKGGNSLFAWNATGLNVKLTMRLVRGSSDDKFMNSLLALFNLDPPLFSLLTAQLVKRLGDGSAGVTSDTYNLSGGIFSKPVAGKENVEGDTDQAVAIYELEFSNGPRTIS